MAPQNRAFSDRGGQEGQAVLPLAIWQGGGGRAPCEGHKSTEMWSAIGQGSATLAGSAVTEYNYSQTHQERVCVWRCSAFRPFAQSPGYRQVCTRAHPRLFGNSPQLLPHGEQAAHMHTGLYHRNKITNDTSFSAFRRHSPRLLTTTLRERPNSKPE